MKELFWEQKGLSPVSWNHTNLKKSFKTAYKLNPVTQETTFEEGENVFSNFG